MYIDISIKEYFDELKLMKEQYGQEEDLYTWIYMLLQMAETKKQKGKNYYKKVSIRDVHKASKCSYLGLKRNDKYWKIRREIVKRVGPPDFVVLDNDETFLGCVEIKVFGKKLLDRTENLSVEKGSEQCKYVLKYFQNRSWEPNNDEDRNYMDNNNISYEEKEKRFVIKGKLEKLEDVVNNILKKGSGMLIDVYDWEYENAAEKLAAGDESNQLSGHLDKFKKVLYTNGLAFYYMELMEENNVEVVELGNFQEIYPNVDSVGERWNNFIQLLSAINWHSKSNINNLRKLKAKLDENKE